VRHDRQVLLIPELVVRHDGSGFRDDPGLLPHDWKSYRDAIFWRCTTGDRAETTLISCRTTRGSCRNEFSGAARLARRRDPIPGLVRHGSEVLSKRNFPVAARLAGQTDATFVSCGTTWLCYRCDISPCGYGSGVISIRHFSVRHDSESCRYACVWSAVAARSHLSRRDSQKVAGGKRGTSAATGKRARQSRPGRGGRTSRESAAPAGARSRDAVKSPMS